MSGYHKQHVVGSLDEWAHVGKKKQNIQTITIPFRHKDKCFVKVFPAFTQAVLEAIQDKKLEGAGDLLFYFMHRAMKSRINGTEDEIRIEATTAQIMTALRKKRSTVLKNRNTLIKLGFLKQPRRGVPDYVLPPEFIYRGVLHKLHLQQVQQGGNLLDHVLRGIRERRPKKSAEK